MSFNDKDSDEALEELLNPPPHANDGGDHEGAEDIEDSDEDYKRLGARTEAKKEEEVSKRNNNWPQ